MNELKEDIELKSEDKADDNAENKESKLFIRTENGPTICVYALIVGLFWVACIIIGLNLPVIPAAIGGLIEVLSPLLYGFLIAFLISPCVSFFENKVFRKWRKKRIGLKRILSIIIAYILILSMLAVVVMFLVPQIISTYSDLSDQLSSNLVSLRNWIAGIMDSLSGEEGSGAYIYYNVSSDYRMSVTDKVIADSVNTPYENFLKSKNTTTQIEVQGMIDSIVQGITTAAKGALPDMLSSALNILTGAKNILLGLIISVYFLVCKKGIIGTLDRIANAWMPSKAYKASAWAVNKAKGIFRDYIVVRVLDSLIVALITFIGLIIVQNPYALLLSVIIAVSALIPFIGPVIGIAVCTLIMFFVGIGYAIGFGAIMVGVQLLDDRIIEPLLYRGYSQHRLAGIWVFSAIVVMSGLFGLMGFLVGIPLFAFIYSVVKDLSEKRLKREGHATDTESYGFVPFKMRSEPRKPPVIIEQWMEAVIGDKSEDEDKAEEPADEGNEGV